MLSRGGYELLESPASHTVLKLESSRICLAWLYRENSYSTSGMEIKLGDRASLIEASGLDEGLIVTNRDSLQLHKESMFKRRTRLIALDDLVEFGLAIDRGERPNVRWM